MSYRAYASDKAESLGLQGTVCNRTDGSVELVAEGTEPELATLLDWCWQGSPWASVSGIDATWSDATDEHSAFQVTPTR